MVSCKWLKFCKKYHIFEKEESKINSQINVLDTDIDNIRFSDLLSFDDTPNLGHDFVDSPDIYISRFEESF